MRICADETCEKKALKRGFLVDTEYGYNRVKKTTKWPKNDREEHCYERGDKISMKDSMERIREMKKQYSKWF